MKHLAVLLLISLSFTSLGLAAPITDAPYIDARIKTLQERIDTDSKSGKLTKLDHDELQHALDRIKQTEQRTRRTGTITPKTRADLRNDLEKVENDIDRKETQSKPSPSPGASPSATH